MPETNPCSVPRPRPSAQATCELILKRSSGRTSYWQSGTLEDLTPIAQDLRILYPNVPAIEIRRKRDGAWLRKW